MINIAGVVSIVLFYLLILAVGIWAGRKKEEGNDSEEEVMLAGRSIGLFVGIFTMTGEANVLACKRAHRECDPSNPVDLHSSPFSFLDVIQRHGSVAAI